MANKRIEPETRSVKTSVKLTENRHAALFALAKAKGTTANNLVNSFIQTGLDAAENNSAFQKQSELAQDSALEKESTAVTLPVNIAAECGLTESEQERLQRAADETACTVKDIISQAVRNFLNGATTRIDDTALKTVAEYTGLDTTEIITIAVNSALSNAFGAIKKGKKADSIKAVLAGGRGGYKDKDTDKPSTVKQPALF